MKFIKYILLISLFCIFGCKSDDFVNSHDGNLIMSSPASFSEETYIWEGFIFPENRTDGK